jgi:hypothetical protein
LTAKGSLKESLQETGHLFRRYSKIIMKSFAWLYFPLWIIAILLSNWITPLITGSIANFLILICLLTLFLVFHYLFIPIIAIYSSCTYNALTS